MKKPILLMPSILMGLTALAGCGEQPATISLYDADSRFVIQSFDEKGSITLPTYRSSASGDVPYVELSEYFYAQQGFGRVKTKIVASEKGYQVQRDSDGLPFLTIDPNKDTFTVENHEHWSELGAINNNVGVDIGAPQDDPTAAVHPSNKTKAIGERKIEVYDGTKYHFDFLEKDGKCYAPTTLLSNLWYRWLASDLLYNGYDYYLSTVVSAGVLPAINRSFYSTNKKFAAVQDADAVSYAPVGEESFRFAYPMKTEQGDLYYIYSLTKDGKGQMLAAKTPTEAGTPAIINDIKYTFDWKQKGDFLYVEMIAHGKSIETGEDESASQGVQKIPLKDGFYASKKRSKEMAEFNYGLLRFQFDNFYGLKDVAGFTSFDEYAQKKGLKEGLLSQEADTYDKTLCSLLNGHIDDGHTRYALPSIQSGKFASDATKMVSENVGPRTKGLLDKRAAYVKLRKDTMNLGPEAQVQDHLGLFMQNSTAVVRFDDFISQGIFISNTFDEGEIPTIDPKAALTTNTPLGFDACFDKIAKNKDIKNVVIDITCNGGGSIMTLPYVLAHFTDDPYIRIHDQNTGVTKEFHYQVDLNHDSVWGGNGDTYKGKYNFYILTSDFSFSCANFLPSMAKEVGVKTIGLKTGGGACAVCVFADATGSTYNFSSPMLCYPKSGEGYAHNDAGVPVDYELPSTSWYDLTKLDAFVSAIK